MVQSVILFGFSSLAPVVAEYLRETKRYDVLACVEESQFLQSNLKMPMEVVALESLHRRYSPKKHVVHVLTSQRPGNPRLNKETICNKIKGLGFKLLTFIDPGAYVASSAHIGENCFIAKDVIVEPFCVVGNGVHMRPKSYLSHASSIGDYSYVAPRAAIAGKVHIGKYCFIGVNATIRDNVTIGDQSIIGAGVVVQKDVISHCVIKAPESRILDRNSDDFNI